MMKKEAEGVLTIEAALIFPIVLSVFVLAIYGGIELYSDVKETVDSIEAEADPDAVSLFYAWKGLEGLIKSED